MRGGFLRLGGRGGRRRCGGSLLGGGRGLSRLYEGKVFSGSSWKESGDLTGVQEGLALDLSVGTAHDYDDSSTFLPF